MSEELVLRRERHRIPATLYGRSMECVLLCPPHPGMGGDRSDSRLVAMAEELAAAGMAALCIDYSDYSGG